MNNRLGQFFAGSMILALLSGCGQQIADSGSASLQDDIATSVPREPEQWPMVAPKHDDHDQIEARVSALLAQMDAAQKVGQIIQPELKVVTLDDVKKYHLGSLLNGGGTFPNNNKYAKISDWVDLTESFYQASMDDSDGAVAVPIIWGTDAVHGHNNVIGATLFPHNIGLGAANNPALMEKIAEVTAAEVAATGITWVFAPTLAAPRNDRWGRTYEGYSEDGALIKRYAGHVIEGLQGHLNEPTFLSRQHVVSTAKHFIGDGGTFDGVDRGDTRVSEADLLALHGQGYLTALASGAQTVMASFNSWNGDRLHGHQYLLTEVLKNRMGFDGFVVGDWNGHSFVPGCSEVSCAAAINAGLDMFMAPGENWKKLYKNTLAQVKNGEISRARIDDAVSRILRVKLRSGLFESGPAARADKHASEVGAHAHREIAREAVRESLVLLKNEQQILPIKAGSHILVAGDGADNIGKQAGGWSISWQGTGNDNSDFPGATSIWQGIAQAAEQNGSHVEFNERGNYTNKPDVAIVVYGENPYAEMQGDITTLEYQNGKGKDLALLEKLKADGIAVVSVFLTGRPLWVTPEINASDAFVVAWLPGSEGGGVADMIMQSAAADNADFRGRLSFSWPKYADQFTLNRGDDNYDPLFPYGYGLSLNDKVSVAALPVEKSASGKAQQPSATYAIYVQRTRDPWFMVMSDGHGGDKRINNNIEETPALAVRSKDRQFQEDSRNLIWQGGRRAEFAIDADQPQYMQAYVTDGYALVFDVLRRDNPDTVHSLQLGMTCGENCTGSIEIADMVQNLTADSWQELSIDLTCFVKRGVDFAKIERLFSLTTADKLELAVNNVRLQKRENNTLNCAQ